MTSPKLSRVDMDAVAPLLPHDKTAAVVGGKGVHYEFQPSDSTKVHSHVPLATRPANGRDRGRPEFVNLEGVTIGRLKVLGIRTDVEKVVSDEQKAWVRQQLDLAKTDTNIAGAV